MTKKQTIIASILSAIFTGVVMYLITYHPHEFITGLLWLVGAAVCFTFIFLLIMMIWTKGDILPNPYPHIEPFDPHIEEKLKQIEEIEKKRKNRK